MNTTPKSTVDEIRARFDAEVDRFSNVETGQTATIDAPLALELIQCAAARVSPHARSLLDVGCGAGNYSIKLLQVLPQLEITLIDLSGPMLDRARERLASCAQTGVTALQGDIRNLEIGVERFDLIVAGMVLHHLRSDAEWRLVYIKLWRALKSGGSLWISDLVEHSIPAVQELMWQRYARYLEELKGAAYRDHVLNYVAREDTPRSLPYQLDLMKEAGFRAFDVLHKNSCFAVFGGIK